MSYIVDSSKLKGTATIGLSGTNVTLTPTTSAIVQNLNYANNALATPLKLIGGDDGTLGPLYLYSGIYPSATAGNRYTQIQAGDNSAYRTISLNPLGGNVGIGLTNPTEKLEVTGNIKSSGIILPQQAATASAPTYVKGGIYFDTTLNKLMVGGATAWETITSV